jgi:ligand-binding SRPBCC domain-containing protein
MTARFTVVTDFSIPVEAAFDLSLDIDAHQASMAASGERAIAGVTSGRIGLGEEVTWRARHFGVPFTMTSRVTALDRPTMFVDEQVRGPFHQFRHAHRFEAIETGTRLTDSVTFTVPCGPFGRAAEHFVLARYLRRLIEVRNEYLGAVDPAT